MRFAHSGGGSVEKNTSPLAITARFRHSTVSLLGGVAQLGERLTGSQEVRGSIPLVSTIAHSGLYVVGTFFYALRAYGRHVGIKAPPQPERMPAAREAYMP